MFKKTRADPIPLPEYLPPQRKQAQKIVKITVNGRELHVPSKYTILEACTKHGIYVPTLCHHPNMAPTGRCGVCVVQVAGCDPPFVKACKTHVQNGMVVFTNTPEVVLQQKTNLQHFMGSKASETFPEMSEIEDLIKYTTHSESVSNGSSVNSCGSGSNVSVGSVKNVYSAPGYAIVRNQGLCVRCTRCVRACSNMQNMNILEIDTQHQQQPITCTGNVPIEDSDCITCGQCTLVCPTEAVTERSDIGAVAKLLAGKSDEKTSNKKIMIAQVGPEALFSLNEAMGVPLDKCNDVSKVTAALHAVGFDYVFDTCFGADVTAYLEGKELTRRLKNGGPWPMFTSCCPTWVKLVEAVNIKNIINSNVSQIHVVASVVRKKAFLFLVFFVLSHLILIFRNILICVRCYRAVSLLR